MEFAFLDWKNFFESIIEVKNSYRAFFVKENTTIFTICNFLTRRYVIISSDVAKVLESDNLTNYTPPLSKQGISDQRKFDKKIPALMYYHVQWPRERCTFPR